MIATGMREHRMPVPETLCHNPYWNRQTAPDYNSRMPLPKYPKLYHLIHVDRVASIIADGYLWGDAEAMRQKIAGTPIGMDHIARRRLQAPLRSRPGLQVGECVSFSFCPRPVMLYVIHKANHPELPYKGGQAPIIHLEVDLRAAIKWADQHRQRWAYTTSNAGSHFFEDYCDLDHLHKIDWETIQATDWHANIDEKQAEFLVERRFPWRLITRIGVCAPHTHRLVSHILQTTAYRPHVETQPSWYY